MFRKVELPVLRSLIRITGAPCIMGGDTAPLAMDLVSTGTSFLICPGETDQEAFLAAMESHPAVMVRVNMRPEIIAAGVHEEILKETDRVCRLASRRDNACVGTGVLPYETDPEIVRMIAARVEAAVSAPGKEHDGNQKSD
jgi:hypothetical protein